MISDLPLCDRLSLKGKIFELQKKLQLIDLEQKLDEQYSYKPQIINYELPNRRNDFLENINKAEIIRKQRKEMLQQYAQQQSEESCTFAPKLYTKKTQHYDNRPVFERLSEKGKAYEDQLERKKQFYQSYDAEGNKLFTPKVNRRQAKLQNHSFNSPNKQDNDSIVNATTVNNTVSAEEFLYQDAKDRELRFQQKLQEHELELQKQANAAKMNSTSKQLLQEKAEKVANKLFAMIDANNLNSVDYKDVAVFFENCKILQQLEKERLMQFQQLFWSVINHYQNERVDRRDFNNVIRAFLLHNSVANALAFLEQCEEQRIVSTLDNSGQGIFSSRSSALGTMRRKNLAEFRTILMKLGEEAKDARVFFRVETRTTASHDGHFNQHVHGSHHEESETFQPQICRKSYKLAEKKEQKEQDALLKAKLQINTQGNAEETTEAEKSPAKERDNMSISASSIRSSQLSQLHERLIARGLLTQHKKENLAQQIRKQEEQQCTFRPKVTNWKKKVAESQKTESQQAEDLANKSESTRNSENPPPIDELMDIFSEDIFINTAEIHIDDLETDDQDDKSDIDIHNDENPIEAIAVIDTAAETIPWHAAEHYTERHTVSTNRNTNGNTDERIENMSSKFHGSHGADESNSNTQSKPPTQTVVYDRLYALKDKKPATSVGATPSYMQELKQCTFAPKIRPAPNQKSARKISGYEKSVDRMRHVVEQKKRQEEEQALAWKRNEESYQRSRELAKKGAAPFAFALEQRRQVRNQHKEVAHDEHHCLMIDVKLAAAKTARIKVFMGDDPLTVAQSFGKIHGLDAAAVQVLSSVVRTSMVQGGLLPPDFQEQELASAGESFQEEDDLSEEQFEDEEYSSYTASELSFDQYDEEHGEDGVFGSYYHEDKRKARRKSSQSEGRRISLLSQLL